MPPPTDSPQRCGAEMLRLLTDQRDIFARLREYAVKQLEIIATGDADALLKLLAEKQRLIERNETLKKEIAPFQTQWEGVRERVGLEVRRAVEAMFADLRGHVAAVVELENQASTQAQGARSRTGDQVQKMQTGKAMLKAYGARRSVAAPPPARYHDKNG